jgi:hypothetical protein
MLPTKSAFLLVPSNALVTGAKVTVLDSVVLSGTYSLPPAQKPVTTNDLDEQMAKWSSGQVTETEPLAADSALRKLENVVLSDHAGWYSEESVPELKTKAAKNVAAVLAGGKPAYPVNTIQAVQQPALGGGR